MIWPLQHCIDFDVTRTISYFSYSSSFLSFATQSTSGFSWPFRTYEVPFGTFNQIPNYGFHLLYLLTEISIIDHLIKKKNRIKSWLILFLFTVIHTYTSLQVCACQCCDMTAKLLENYLSIRIRKCFRQMRDNRSNVRERPTNLRFNKQQVCMRISFQVRLI